jgi:transcription elongation factor GreA
VTEVLITQDGLARLSAEVERLHGEWADLADRVQAAIAHGGGLAENGEFLHARQEQELLELRLATLERRLDAARLVEPERDGALGVGERVRVRDVASGEVLEYRIVGTGEGDPAQGAVAHDAPVGAALLGRRRGEVVEIELPRGRQRLEVLDVDG